MNNLLRRLGRLWPLWLGIWAVAFILTASIGVIFGVVGIAEMQKQNPHAFNNSFLSYDTLYLLCTMSPVVMLSTLIFVVLLIAWRPSEKSTDNIQKEIVRQLKLWQKELGDDPLINTIDEILTRTYDTDTIQKESTK